MLKDFTAFDRIPESHYRGGCTWLQGGTWFYLVCDYLFTGRGRCTHPRGSTWSRGVYLVLGVYLVPGVYLVTGGVPGPGDGTWS